MAERKTEPVWRVVTHPRGGAGWWTLRPERFTSWAAAAQYAARACTPEGGCSNAGVYAEVDGVVQLPGWLTVREEQGGGA